MSNKFIVLILIMCLMISACLVGPNYHRAPVMISPLFKEAKGKPFIASPKKNWTLAQPRDDIERGQWWKLFNDKPLNELEDKLNRCNQNIINAAANYYQAQAIVNQAQASLFPTLSGTYSMQRQTQGSGTSSFTSSSIQSGTITSTAATAGILTRNTDAVTRYTNFFNANWEPDFWGQVRRTIEQDQAAAQSSAALWAVTRLSAQASLAQYYFQLRALDKDQQLLDATVVGYKKTLQLTRNQYASGVASQADIVQAQSQLEVAQAQAINNGILRGQYEHAIAVLIGLPPANFSLSFMPLTSLPPTIPITVPSVLLERRPDVAQAERLMKQTNAAIGVAYAAYYPSINLAGSVSGASTNLGDLINNPIIGWSLATTVFETIFDGGLRNATVRAAYAAYDAQVASYRQTVLSAFQDVEDNLISLRILKEQSITLKKAASSAKLALKLVTNQYKAGIVPFSSVLTSQIAAYSAEKNAADAIGLEMTSAVGLIKALGGGWNCALLNPMFNTQMRNPGKFF